MSDKLTAASVQEFLKDFLANSETQILEEGKEVDDILAVAAAKGYNLKNRLSLAGFKTIYTFADAANKNKARLPKAILLKVLPEIIGTPVNIDHIRDYVVGHYIDYRYKATEDMIVAYGVFYKSNFGDEWKKAQQLFKSGKLGTSYEIYCPKSKRKYLPDGTYELTTMEIAGGALIFKETPAFEDAKVLEMAKKIIEDAEADLVIASVKKYEDADLITSATDVIEAPVEKVAIATFEQLKAVVPEVAPVIPVIPKIKCQNCQQEFDNAGMVATQSEKKCPHCKAIVGEQGEVKYPPQIMDFNVSCPSCRSSNWKLVKSEEDSAQVQCSNCNKSYQLGFEKHTPNEMLGKIAFVYLGSANCPQCGSHIPFSTTSQNKNKSLTCPSCALKFNVDISKMDNKRKISKIEELADLHKASAEGGNKEMEQKDEVNSNVEAPKEAVIETVVPVVEAPAAVVAQAAEVPVVAPAEAPVVAEVVVPAEVVADVEVPVVPVEEVKPEVPEMAAKKVKTEEEIEKMELDLCKVVAKNKQYKNFFKAACNKIRNLKKASMLNKASQDEFIVTQSENEELKAKVQLLETAAVKIVERKNMLGDAAKDLSEKDILDDGKFELARVKKENADLKSGLVTASAHVAVKTNDQRSEAEITQIRANIDKKAFSTK